MNWKANYANITDWRCWGRRETISFIPCCAPETFFFFFFTFHGWRFFLILKQVKKGTHLAWPPSPNPLQTEWRSSLSEIFHHDGFFTRQDFTTYSQIVLGSPFSLFSSQLRHNSVSTSSMKSTDPSVAICPFLHAPQHFLSVGEGNGNPLQCSCMENPRQDRGTWWATVLGVAKNWTRLND